MGNDRGCSLGAVGLAFLDGGLVGAAVALLLAPQAGRESREQLRGYGAANRREFMSWPIRPPGLRPGGGQGTRVRPGEKGGPDRGGRGRTRYHARERKGETR